MSSSLCSSNGSILAGAASREADFSFLRRLVHEHSHNVLDPSRDYLFMTRLAGVLQGNGMTQVEELVRLLRTERNPALERSIAEAMTINETSFFRDVRPFELLRTHLLPQLVLRRRFTRTLRLWSAACSTGQEALSLAMLILESFPQLADWNIRIEGTDISSEVVERAQGSTYRRFEINRGLPAKYIVRFFDFVSGEWTAKPEVRRLCNFRQADLCGAQLPFTEQFDVVFLRNVMLYFSRETRVRLLTNVHRLIAPDGLLFLGSSEQPASAELWDANVAGSACYYTPRAG